MDAISVREAGPDDFADVAALLTELGRPAVLGEPDEDAHRARYLEWIAHPDRYVFVAEHGGSVVGLVDLVIGPRLNFLAPEAWIPDLVVAEAARSRGAGAALLERAERVARDRGAWGIRLESANWRARAHAFYLREGYADSAKAFGKALGDFVWPPHQTSEG